MRVFAPALSKARFEQLLCASAVEQDEERQVVEITIRERMKAGGGQSAEKNSRASTPGSKLVLGDDGILAVASVSARIAIKSVGPAHSPFSAFCAPASGNGSQRPARS